MANPAVVYGSGKAGQCFGTLISGAFTNDDWDLDLSPGHWRITLFINANGVSAGTLTAAPFAADGTTVLNEESFAVSRAGGAITFADHVGPADISSSALIPTPIGIYGKIRFTIASIAGAGATNRIDFVATRTDRF